MNMARHTVIAENKAHAHRKTHLHTMKVYNTRPVSLTIELITCSKVISPIKRENPWTDPFRKSSTSFAAFYSMDMKSCK